MFNILSFFPKNKDWLKNGEAIRICLSYTFIFFIIIYIFFKNSTSWIQILISASAIILSALIAIYQSEQSTEQIIKSKKLSEKTELEKFINITKLTYSLFQNIILKKPFLAENENDCENLKLIKLQCNIYFYLSDIKKYIQELSSFNLFKYPNNTECIVNSSIYFRSINQTISEIEKFLRHPLNDSSLHIASDAKKIYDEFCKDNPNNFFFIMDKESVSNAYKNMIDCFEKYIRND